MTGPARTSLWDFSLAIYDKPGVKPACLAIQSDGLDVNIALWISWTSWQGHDPVAALDQAIETSARWSQHVVHPLRGVRDYLKVTNEASDPAIQNLRRQVLATELEAERLQQGWLDDLFTLCPSSDEDGKTLCGKALVRYADRLGSQADTVNFTETIFSALESV